MKTMVLRNTSIHKKINQSDSILLLCRSRNRWAMVLFLSSGLGGFSILTGLIISGLSLFGFLENNKGISNWIALLLAGAFPLLMFAAHCLDKIDEADKAEKALSILSIAEHTD